MQTYLNARGRLHAVSQRDASNSGYNWTAVYDPLNRRISTTTVLVTNGVAYPSSVQTINSYFDPQFEFLELGVSYGTKTEWKLYGPDINGQYGGLNGVGGLDGVSPGLSLFNPTASDVRGNILGYYDSSIGSVTWNAARPTGYGAVPNYRPVALADGATLAQSSAWRGHWVDITGYYNIGMRPYDPISGRWLTYDSLWNARDPNYYTFCGGDPINSFDRDGRISKATYLYQSTFGQQQFTYDPQLLAEIDSEFSPPQLTPDQMYQLLPPSATVGIGIIDPTEIAAEQQYENEPTAQKVAQAFPFGDLGYQIYSDSASGNLDALGQDSQQVAEDAITMILTDGALKVASKLTAPNISAPETPPPSTPPSSQVVFGQARISPNFSNAEGVPDYLAGRPISDVAADLQAGNLSPDQLPVQAFEYNGQTVTINNRTLAALSEAGMEPTVVNMTTPTANQLARLQEPPIINSPIPGPQIPVTFSQSDQNIIRVIQIPSPSQ